MMQPASHFRDPPRGITRALARLPVRIYGLGLGWLLTSRFLLLEHRGRRTGSTRKTVLEVIHQERRPRTVFAASGWGHRSQWFRNVQADPNVRITVGRRRFEAVARVLDPGEAEEVLRTYKRRHRIAARGMKRLFGSDDPEELSRVLPIVAFAEKPEGPGAAAAPTGEGAS